MRLVEITILDALRGSPMNSMRTSLGDFLGSPGDFLGDPLGFFFLGDPLGIPDALGDPEIPSGFPRASPGGFP